jgi:hypothetical protein
MAPIIGRSPHLRAMAPAREGVRAALRIGSPRRASSSRSCGRCARCGGPRFWATRPAARRSHCSRAFGGQDHHAVAEVARTQHGTLGADEQQLRFAAVGCESGQPLGEVTSRVREASVAEEVAADAPVRVVHGEAPRGSSRRRMRVATRRAARHRRNMATDETTCVALGAGAGRQRRASPACAYCATSPA